MKYKTVMILNSLAFMAGIFARDWFGSSFDGLGAYLIGLSVLGGYLLT